MSKLNEKTENRDCAEYKVLKKILDNYMCEKFGNSLENIENNLKDISTRLKDLQNANYYVNLGNKYSVDGDYTEAIKQYDLATQQDNNYYLAWYYLGEAYRQLLEYNLAINAYTKAVKIEPGLHRGWYYKSACHALAKQWDEAIESLKKAIEPLQQTNDNLPEQDEKTGEQQYKEKAKADPAFTSINDPYYLACFYALVDEKEKALEYLQIAVTGQDKEINKEKAITESAFNTIKDDENFKNLINNNKSQEDTTAK
jgi:tetratricopeptide (TPR) repeat protein